MTPPPGPGPGQKAALAVPGPARGAGPARKAPREVPAAEVRPAIAQAGLRRRHYGVLMSFIALVVLPVALSAWYLWTRAVDQYESRIGFAVRAEGQVGTPDLLNGLLGPASSSTAEDMHILSAFILSQELVSRIDARLDLRQRYSLFPADPVYSLAPEGTIEELVDYWERMVVVDYSSTTGLMELTIYAFTPADAQAIAALVLEESSAVINQLSAIAREDSTRFAREALDTARARAGEARAAVARFRATNKVADPSADIASHMGVVSSLQQQLAGALVELDMLRLGTKADDPRIGPLERRIEAIEGRIDQERADLGIGIDGAGFAEVLGEYERLKVDQTFAEQAYLAALSAHDAAMAVAGRNSRYLATFVPPTLAEASTAPVRPLVLLVIGIIALLGWSSLVLIFYALRDRR
ncbi:MAG: hypothetical protein ACT4N9_01730 [Paracoccaceae bacterium]